MNEIYIYKLVVAYFVIATFIGSCMSLDGQAHIASKFVLALVWPLTVAYALLAGSVSWSKR